MSNTLRIKSSHPEHTHAGKLLAKMYYGGFIDKTLVMNEESFGYPHNGGYHSLTLRLSKDDAKAFVELVEERYDGHPGLKDFSQHIRAQLH